MLKDAIAHLDTQRKAFMSETFAYVRGVDSVVLSALLGSTDFEVADESGFLVQAKSIDFIVSAADLVLAGSVVTPEIGDRFVGTIAGEAQEFEVLDLGGAGHYRPSDSHGIALRIHTKRVV